MRLLQANDIFEGRYRIEDVLGDGGFAFVYAATDFETNTEVALKILRPDDGDRYKPVTSTRFLREVVVVRQLRCPHTVRLLDHGETADGLLYMVFEYLAGRDLRDVINDRGRLDPSDVVVMLEQLLESLREAHSLGVLHRDLKPENIRIQEDASGQLNAKLLDFGIARPTADVAPSITKSNELVGTPRYMSPEQLLKHSLGPASDIYSLGIVAFESLAGSEAMQGGSVADQLQRLMADHVFSLPDLEHYGAALLNIVTRMTAREPADRYPTADAVLASLRRLDASDLVEPKPLERPRQPAGKKRRIAAVVAVVMVIGAIAYALTSTREDAAQPVARRSNVARLLATQAVPRPSIDAGTTPPDAVEVGTGAADLGEFATAGCGIAPPFRGQGMLDGTLLTYVPTGYRVDRPHAIVVLLHRNGSSAGEFLNIGGFREIAEREHFILIAPEDGLRLMGVQEGAWKDHDDDARRVHGAWMLAAEELCTDSRRVFVVGNDDGARIADWASCQGWAAATASNSHRLGGKGFVCPEPPAVPHIEISPRHSRLTPLAGGRAEGYPGYETAPLEAAEEGWRERNHCSSAKPKVEDFTHGSCRTWDCEEPLVSCVVDGGHGWSGEPVRGRDEYFGEPRPGEFATAERVWSFFAALNDK